MKKMRPDTIERIRIHTGGNRLERMILASMKNRTRRCFATVLAGIVVFTTTYAMILPAITLERNEASRMAGMDLTNGTVMAEQLNCKVEIHQHTADCYEMIDGEEVLVCGKADYVLHQHNDNCYNKGGIWYAQFLRHMVKNISILWIVMNKEQMVKLRKKWAG